MLRGLLKKFTGASAVKEEPPKQKADFDKGDQIKLNESINMAGVKADAGIYTVSSRAPREYVLLPESGGKALPLPIPFVDKHFEIEKRFNPLLAGLKSIDGIGEKDLLMLEETIDESWGKVEAGVYSVYSITPQNQCVLAPTDGGESVTLSAAFIKKHFKMEEKFLPDGDDPWGTEHERTGGENSFEEQRRMGYFGPE